MKPNLRIFEQKEHCWYLYVRKIKCSTSAALYVSLILFIVVLTVLAYISTSASLKATVHKTFPGSIQISNPFHLLIQFCGLK